MNKYWIQCTVRRSFQVGEEEKELYVEANDTDHARSVARVKLYSEEKYESVFPWHVILCKDESTTNKELPVASPEDEILIQFNEMCDKVRIYFEIAKSLEQLDDHLYEQLLEPEDFVMRDEADEDEVESIISTIAEALSPSSPNLEW